MKKAEETRTKTKDHPRAKQMIAIREIIAGATDKEAAKKAGVHPSQLSLWRNHNIAFIQALREEESRISDAVRSEITEITKAALTTIKTHITNGDAASAKWWLDRCVPLGDSISEAYQQLILSQQTAPQAIAHEIATRECDLLLAQEDNPLDAALMRDAAIAKMTEELLEAHNQESHRGACP